MAKHEKGKGLMNRRKSFKQSSVPNAKKGSAESPPYIMIVIFFLMAVLSFILAKLSV